MRGLVRGRQVATTEIAFRRFPFLADLLVLSIRHLLLLPYSDVLFPYRLNFDMRELCLPDPTLDPWMGRSRARHRPTAKAIAMKGRVFCLRNYFSACAHTVGETYFARMVRTSDDLLARVAISLALGGLLR